MFLVFRVHLYPIHSANLQQFLLTVSYVPGTVYTKVVQSRPLLHTKKHMVITLRELKVYSAAQTLIKDHTNCVKCHRGEVYSVNKH